MEFYHLPKSLQRLFTKHLKKGEQITFSFNPENGWNDSEIYIGRNDLESIDSGALIEWDDWILDIIDSYFLDVIGIRENTNGTFGISSDNQLYIDFWFEGPYQDEAKSLGYDSFEVLDEDLTDDLLQSIDPELIPELHYVQYLDYSFRYQEKKGLTKFKAYIYDPIRDEAVEFNTNPIVKAYLSSVVLFKVKKILDECIYPIHLNKGPLHKRLRGLKFSKYIECDVGQSNYYFKTKKIRISLSEIYSEIELHQAFKNTSYQVEIDDKTIEIRVHQPPQEVISFLGVKQSFLFITAYNPSPKILSESDNQKMNTQLLKEIQSEGYSWSHGVGWSEDRKWKEDSFLVRDISLDRSIVLAEKYGQKAIVYWEERYGLIELIYT